MDTILVSTAPEPWPRATDAIVAAALSASGNLRSDAESGAGSTNDGNSAVVANGGTADSAVPSVRVAYVDNPKPDYPAAARETGAQGTVLLRVLVDRKGLAAKIDLQRRSGFTDLDRAALEKVKLWRFRPARRGDRLIEDWVTIPIVFRLDDVVSKP
jgi:protein TonB